MVGWSETLESEHWEHWSQSWADSWVEHRGDQGGNHDLGNLEGNLGQACGTGPYLVVPASSPYQVHQASSYQGVLPYHRVVSFPRVPGAAFLLVQGSQGGAFCTCPCEEASPDLAYQGAVDNLGEGSVACQEDHCVVEDDHLVLAAVAVVVDLVLMLVEKTATVVVREEYWSLVWSLVTEVSWVPWDCLHWSDEDSCSQSGQVWIPASPSAPELTNCWWQVVLELGGSWMMVCEVPDCWVSWEELVTLEMVLMDKMMMVLGTEWSLGLVMLETVELETCVEPAVAAAVVAVVES